MGNQLGFIPHTGIFTKKMKTFQNLKKIGLAALIALAPMTSKAQDISPYNQKDSSAPISSEFKENSPHFLMPTDGGPVIKAYPLSETYKVNNSTPPYTRIDYNPSKYTINELIDHIKESGERVIALPYKDKPSNNLKAMPSTAKKIPIIGKENCDLLSDSFGKTGIQFEINNHMPICTSYSNDKGTWNYDWTKESTNQYNYNLMIKSQIQNKRFLTFGLNKEIINKGNSSYSHYDNEYSTEEGFANSGSNGSDSNENSDETLASILFSMPITEGVEIGAGAAYLSRRGFYNQNISDDSWSLYSDKNPDDDLYATVYQRWGGSSSQGTTNSDCNGSIIKISNRKFLPLDFTYTTLEGRGHNLVNYIYDSNYSEAGYDNKNNRLYRNIESYDGSYEQNNNYAEVIEETEMSVPLRFDKISLAFSYKNRLESILQLEDNTTLKNTKESYGAQIRYNLDSFVIGAKYSCTREARSLYSSEANSSDEKTYDKFGITVGYEFMDKKEGKK